MTAPHVIPTTEGRRNLHVASPQQSLSIILPSSYLKISTLRARCHCVRNDNWWNGLPFGHDVAALEMTLVRVVRSARNPSWFSLAFLAIFAWDKPLPSCCCDTQWRSDRGNLQPAKMVCNLSPATHQYTCSAERRRPVSSRFLPFGHDGAALEMTAGRCTGVKWSTAHQENLLSKTFVSSPALAAGANVAPPIAVRKHSRQFVFGWVLLQSTIWGAPGSGAERDVPGVRVWLWAPSRGERCAVVLQGGMAGL